MGCYHPAVIESQRQKTIRICMSILNNPTNPLQEHPAGDFLLRNGIPVSFFKPFKVTKVRTAQSVKLLLSLAYTAKATACHHIIEERELGGGLGQGLTAYFFPHILSVGNVYLHRKASFHRYHTHYTYLSVLTHVIK